MLWASDLPATGMTWKYVVGEMIELIQEIKDLNYRGIIAEACDVYTCVSCAVLTSTGIDLPILWNNSAKEWFHRVEALKLILADRGLVFKEEYLRYGANYNKPHKMAIIVGLASLDQIRRI